LTVSVVHCRPGWQWCFHGVDLWKGATEASLAVDLVGVLDYRTERPVLLLGECKRNPQAYRAARALAGFDTLVSAAAASPDAVRKAWKWPPAPGWPGPAGAWRRHLAVSPHFPPDANRARLEARGFDCVGIRDMARALGVDPGPCVEAEAQPSDVGGTFLDGADPAAVAFAIPDVNADRRERLESLTARMKAHGASPPEMGPLPEAPKRMDFDDFFLFRKKEADWLDFMIGVVEDTLYEIGDFDYGTGRPLRAFSGTADMENDGTGGFGSATTCSAGEGSGRAGRVAMIGNPWRVRL